MTTTPNDGGPAFPVPEGHAPVQDYQPGHGAYARTVAVSTKGMSLRDWFAGMALCGLCALSSHAILNAYAKEASRNNEDNSSLTFARSAYEYADAMLAERAKQQEADHVND